MLPSEDLGEFIVDQFRAGRKRCPNELGLRISSIVGYHPYYAQKLAFFVYETAGKITEGAIQEGLEKLVSSEKPVFEAIIQGLSPHQRLLLKALALEPTEKALASGYIQKHRLGSVGGMQHSTRQLADLDLIEKDEETGHWQPVDPILSVWLKRQMEEKILGKVNSV